MKEIAFILLVMTATSKGGNIVSQQEYASEAKCEAAAAALKAMASWSIKTKCVEK